MKNTRHASQGSALIVAVLAIAVIAVIGFAGYTISQKDKATKDSAQTSTATTPETKVASLDLKAPYNPQLKPADFTTTIDNKFLTLKPGKVMEYEAKTDEGIERTEISIDGKTKNINGFETLIYLDRNYLDGVLVEETRDYLAQHKATGDVWYFGENVDNYKNGKLVDHDGTFLHGTDGAKAGIWIKGTQKVGDSYRQEYFKGEAEDVQDVVAVNQTVKTKRATYTGCVKVYAWTPLEKDSREYKYNCPEVGGEVLIIDLEDDKRAELVNVTGQ